MEKLRLAIVGAGPAGIYAADLMLKAERDFEVSIDLFEHLPAPYGLVRYGVSPDHPRIKGIVKALREVLVSGDIRFFGNVRYGADLKLDDLKQHYHAVIFATGAIRDATLNIPGIESEGSYGSAEFVSWFDGHPDVPRTWPLEATDVAVIGNGNVALDVSRMLTKQADDLLNTEIPNNVYEGLKANPLTDLHIFGRRGPASVKFTPLELRELGDIKDAEIVLDERDFEIVDEHADELRANNKQVLVMTRILNKWRDAQRERLASDAPVASRRLHMHFWSKPVEVLTEDGRVAGIKIERTAPDGTGGIIDTGVFEDYPVQSVYRAVGYFGSAVDEIPFDEHQGVIPNDRGRVVDAEGDPVQGVYATGWIKRGPIGLIGHTKSDAMETLEQLIADRDKLWQPTHTDEAVIPALLAERGVSYTTIEGWQRLDEYELALGITEGRERVKVVPREEMTQISKTE